MDPGQILWKATYPPYLQTVFFSVFKTFDFQIFIFFFFLLFLNTAIWEPKFKNATSLRLLLPQFSSNFNQTLWEAWYSWRNTGCYLFGDLPKIKNLIWHYKIFVNTGPYGAGNFKTLLLQFSYGVSQTL